MKKTVTVNDRMQRNYRYERVAAEGRGFDPEFTPDLTPKQMLQLGVFGGKYMTDCRREFPDNWFAKAKLSPKGKDIELNYFGVDASQKLQVWRQKGWIHHQDPRGWFQWYCRYYMGRRTDDDARQIGRWKAIRRHIAQVKKNCECGDPYCRPRQRQDPETCRYARAHGARIYRRARRPLRRRRRCRQPRTSAGRP